MFPFHEAVANLVSLVLLRVPAEVSLVARNFAMAAAAVVVVVVVVVVIVIVIVVVVVSRVTEP